MCFLAKLAELGAIGQKSVITQFSYKNPLFIWKTKNAFSG